MRKANADAALKAFLLTLYKQILKTTMKKIITLVLISVGIFGFSNAVNAQKIGYISADEVIQLMPEAATVQTQLDEYQKSLYQNAQDQQNALNEAVQKFYKDSATMSASLKEVKRTELQKQVQELSGADQKNTKISSSKKDRNFLYLFKRNCKQL